MEESKFYFECYRCNHIFYLKTDMKRHLSKKKRCDWTNKAPEDMNDENIMIRSLMRKKIKDTKDIKDEEEIHECEYCQKEFNTQIKLDLHKITCRIKINTPSDHLIKKENDTVIIQNIDNHIDNHIEINQQMNIINLHVGDEVIQKEPRSFDDKFDISHMSDFTKVKMILSNIKPKLLSELLENQSNHNYFLYKGEYYTYKSEDEPLMYCEEYDFYDKMIKKLKETQEDMLEELKEKEIVPQKEDMINSILSCFKSRISKSYSNDISDFSQESREKKKILHHSIQQVTFEKKLELDKMLRSLQEKHHIKLLK